MNRIKVSTYAKRVGLSPQAVRSYFHAGKIPGIQLDTGTILLDDPDTIIHADVNGAYNILRKRKPSFGWSRGFVVKPTNLAFSY